jgi:hypothetical protein
MNDKKPPKTTQKTTIKTVNTILPNWRELGLTIKEARFVVTYLTNGYNALQAYKCSGFKCANDNVAGVLGFKLLKKDKIAKAVDQHMEEFLLDKAKVARDILQGYVDMASFDPAELLDKYGGLKYKTLEEVPKNLRQMIAGIETRQTGTVIKFYSKTTAMEKLGEYSGLFKGAHQKSVSLTEDTVNLLGKVFGGKK